jgi:xylulokinase
MRQMKDPIQANVRGTGFIAAVGLGLLSYDDVPAQIEVRREYAPNREHRELYDAYFREFVNIYRRNRDIFRRLNARRRAGK